MATKFVSRQNVLVIFGAVMIVFLALTIVTFPVALIWVGQPPGNVAITMADAFATVFSVAFFAAFASRWPSRGRPVQQTRQLSCFGRRYHTITRTIRKPTMAATNVVANAQLLSAIFSALHGAFDLPCSTD